MRSAFTPLRWFLRSPLRHNSCSIALTALNVVSTLMECGFGACPDNPLAYELLKRAP